MPTVATSMLLLWAAAIIGAPATNLMKLAFNPTFSNRPFFCASNVSQCESAWVPIEMGSGAPWAWDASTFGA